jgi:hypothetical protein
VDALKGNGVPIDHGLAQNNFMDKNSKNGQNEEMDDKHAASLSCSQKVLGAGIRGLVIVPKKSSYLLVLLWPTRDKKKIIIYY